MSGQEQGVSALDIGLTIVVLVLLILVVGLYVFAMPKYGEQFEDLGVELPHLTVMVLNASRWIRFNWLFLALILVTVGGPIMALGRGGVRTVFLILLALALLALLVAGFRGVYLPAQHLGGMMGPASGAAP